MNFKGLNKFLTKFIVLVLLLTTGLINLQVQASTSNLNQSETNARTVGSPLDPKEFLCGNKDANATECTAYQAGQIATGAIIAKAIGAIIPKPAKTIVGNITKKIDDGGLKTAVGAVDDIKNKIAKPGTTNPADDIDPVTGKKKGIPCYSKVDNLNQTPLDHAVAFLFGGIRVEACREEVSVDFNQQDKHIAGTNAYKNLIKNGNSPSVLTADPKSLVGKVGSGEQVGDLKIKLGDPGSKEIIDFGSNIGIWSNADGSELLITTKATVHYSKNGVHFVPAYPN